VTDLEAAARAFRDADKAAQAASDDMHSDPLPWSITKSKNLAVLASRANQALEDLLTPILTETATMVAARTREITSPPYTPPAPRPDYVPPAAECTRSELLDLAAHAATDADCMDALTDNREHIAAICTLACDQEQELIALRLELDRARTMLADARDRQQCLTLDLEAAQAAGLATARMADTADMLRAAALADANDLRCKHAALVEENRTLRIQAGLNTACLTITGRAASELQRDWAAEDKAERPRRAAYPYELFDFTDETVIVDVATLGDAVEVPPALDSAEAFL
jgi:hypothetical protein